MKRPVLNEVPLEYVIPPGQGAIPPVGIITMSRGQWDCLLQEAYERGWILLELNDQEKPVKAYRKLKG